jgi:HAD superfamily hydrolase (TIGR01509 family)
MAAIALFALTEEGSFVTLHKMLAPIQIPPHIRALLFDCDGTLIDTMPLHWRAELETLRDLGIEVDPEWLAGHRGATMPDVIAAISRYTGRAIDTKDYIARKQVRFSELLPEAREIKVVADLARAQFGRLPMGVVSGGFRCNVLASIKSIGLARHFSVVLTADDPFPGKPAPDAFLAAARELGIAPEHCQVFEDGDLGLDAARTAGMLATDIRPWLAEDEAGG